MSDNSGLISSALEKTDPKLAHEIDAENSWRSGIRKRGARVNLYRDYERGKHRASVTGQMRDMLRIRQGDDDLQDFNDNYCRVIIDKFAARLFVANIRVEDSAQEWLNETLARNDFISQQIEWWRGTIRDGDGFVSVDSETLRWVSEPAYDGFRGMVVIKDDLTREIIWACKLWGEADAADTGDNSTAQVIKVVVYQPDRVTYWTGTENGSDVQPAPVVVDEGVKVLEDGNGIEWPIGKVAIVDFANQRDNFTTHGESELRPAVPLQDVLNRTLHSMVMASEFSAFGLRWSIGFEIVQDGVVPGGIINIVLKDANGKIITEPTEEQLELLKSASVGEFEATDISQYTNQIDKIVQQLSQSTQTPIYGVTTQGNLSGEALKQLEIGLLGKIERFQRQNTDAVKELINLTAEMQNKFDTVVEGTAPETGKIMVIWRSPEILDVNARIATFVDMRQRAPGLFTDEFIISQIGSLLGMSQDDIKEQVEQAKSQQGFLFDALTGGTGAAPVV
jgi:hypothetical protein